MATFVGVEVVEDDEVLVVCAAVEPADNPLGPLVAPVSATPFVPAADDNWCWTVVSVPFLGLSGPAFDCGLPEGSTRTIIAILLPLTVDNEKQFTRGRSQ